MQRSRTLDRTAGLLALGLLAATLSATACRDDTGPASKATLTYGPTVAFGRGAARAFVQTDAQGAPATLGIALTETALDALPTTVSGPNPAAIMATLALPAEAAGTGFDHAEIGFNPLGHDPLQIYGVPHFDFHFYMVSTAAQMAILPTDAQFATKAANVPAAAYVPAGYVPPPSPIAANAIPQMGVHWTDVKSSEFNGQAFSRTFIFGSWDGKFIFLEPMITKAFLDSKPSATQAIPQPAQWSAAGAYPTAYSIKYDATAKEYRITLDNLTRRTP